MAQNLLPTCTVLVYCIESKVKQPSAFRINEQLLITTINHMTKEGVAPLDELSLINRFLFKSADITEVLSQLVITHIPHLSLSSQVKVPITFSLVL